MSARAQNESTAHVWPDLSPATALATVVDPLKNQMTSPGWTFLTNHAQALVCIAGDPGIRLRDIGDSVGITERAAHRIVTELADAGYITRQRNRRRNHYTVNVDVPLPDPVAREKNVGELLAVLTDTRNGEPTP